MINWNNLLKCLSFGALAPSPFLWLLVWLGVNPLLLLLAGYTFGMVAAAYAIKKWNPID